MMGSKLLDEVATNRLEGVRAWRSLTTGSSHASSTLMRTAASLIVVVGIVSACSDANAPRAARPSPLGFVTIVSGASQHGTVGTTLAAPIVIQATDSNGHPAVGLHVDFSPIIGFGEAKTVTDSVGRASYMWPLNTTAGKQSLWINVVDTLRADFGIIDTTSAIALPGPPAMILNRFGDQQVGVVGTPLADSLGAAVRDQYGNSLSGLTVTWTITGGGGSLQPTTSTTDSIGIAWSHWTLGPSAGWNTATAAMGSLTPAVFQAQALP